jgi:hypothetical protein
MTEIETLIQRIIGRIENQISESIKDYPNEYSEQCHRRALREALTIIQHETIKMVPPKELPKPLVVGDDGILRTIDQKKNNDISDIKENAGQAINAALAKRGLIGSLRTDMADDVWEAIKPYLKEETA